MQLSGESFCYRAVWGELWKCKTVDLQAVCIAYCSDQRIREYQKRKLPAKSVQVTKLAQCVWSKIAFGSCDLTKLYNWLQYAQLFTGTKRWCQKWPLCNFRWIWLVTGVRPLLWGNDLRLEEMKLMFLVVNLIRLATNRSKLSYLLKWIFH